MNEPTLLQHEKGKSSQKMSHQMINLKDGHPLFVFLYAIVELCKTGENHVDCKNEEITIPCPCLFILIAIDKLVSMANFLLRIEIRC